MFSSAPVAENGSGVAARSRRPNTDADDESEASGVLVDWDNRAHLSEGDLCLTGRGKRVVPWGNGGKGYGNWGGQGGDRNSMYGRNWEGRNRDRWNYDINRDRTSYSQGIMGPIQGVHGTRNPPCGDPDTCIASHSVAY